MTDKQSPAEVYLASLDDGVAVVRIDRPDAKNALNGAVRCQLAEMFLSLSQDDFPHPVIPNVVTIFFIS